MPLFSQQKTTPLFPRITARASVASLLVFYLVGGVSINALAAGDQSSVDVSEAHNQQMVSFRIPPQSLISAVNQFGEQADIAFAYRTGDLENLQSPGVNGAYQPGVALQQLLAGTGVDARFTDSNTVTLLVVQNDPDMTTLPPVTIRATLDDSRQALPQTYPGGLVAEGGRLGILGNTDLMDAPFNATAYTSETIETQQARSVADVLVNNDASVRLVGGRGDINDDYTIRGFAVSSQDVAINGLYGLLPYWRVPTEFAERVELLRGPSAMLGGMAPSGGIGGTINVVPKRAAADPLNRLSFDYTSDSQAGTHIDVGRRFGTDNAYGARFNGVYRDGDTAVENQQREFPMASLGMDFQGEKLTLETDILIQQEHTNGVVRPVLLQPGVSIPDAPDSGKLFGMKNSYADQKMSSITTGAEYRLNDHIDLFATVGTRQSKWDTKAANIYIADSSTGDIMNGSARQRADRRTYSGEAGLRANFDTGSVGHELTFGASRMDHTEGLIYVFFPTVPGNLYQPPINIDVDGSELDGDIPTTIENVFSSLSLIDQISLMDRRLQLTLGVRRQWISSDSFDPETGATTGAYDEEVWAPMGGITYAINPELNIYANATEGLSQGETAPNTASNPGEMLAPYKTRQYEIGMKYDRGNVGASWSAFQIEKPSAFVDATNIFRQDGEQRNRGLELNIFGEPFNGVRLLGGLSYIEPELLQTEGGVNDGNDARGVSRRQANIGVYWDIPGVEGAHLNARWIYTGEAWLDQGNTLRVPGWQRYDVGGSYRFKASGKPVLVSFNIENLFGEDYWQSASFYDGLTVSAPRTVTLSATIDF